MGWKAAQKLIRHGKILRGDNMMIIRGKEKGETGIVERVIRSLRIVYLSKAKIWLRGVLNKGRVMKLGSLTVEAPLHVSNVWSQGYSNGCRAGKNL